METRASLSFRVSICTAVSDEDSLVDHNNHTSEITVNEVA